MKKFNHHKYTYSRPWGSPRHAWSIVGPVGAVSFHASVYKEGAEPSCGLEFHHSARANMYAGEAPNHLNCDVIGEPCWHDGTSLYASETLWPMVESYLRHGEHEQVFRLLEHEYASRFEGREYRTSEPQRDSP